MDDLGSTKKLVRNKLKTEASSGKTCRELQLNLKEPLMEKKDFAIDKESLLH
jgi:predicted transcriptional regulator